MLADARISFSKTTHDFGTIQEKDGDVKAEFEFTNEGDTPLLIIRATASCGCTTPEHPKKPLRPGEKGVITVTYHAKGRPGPFDKSIYVYTNDAQKERHLLTINGNVISSTGVRESYVEELGGGLRLKTKTVNFFDVYPGRAYRTRTLSVYNEGSKPMQLTYRNVPAHVYVECEPEVVQPKTEGRVLITYLADKVKDWGPRNDMFDIYVKGQETHMQDNHILLMADIWEDFSGLSREQREQAPEIEVSATSLDFGKGDQPRSRTVTIRNTGHERLRIRKIQNGDTDAFQTSVASMSIKPGETTELRITFDPQRADKRNVSEHITIISTDPANSRVIIKLQAGY